MNNNNFNSSVDKDVTPNDQKFMINLFKKNVHLTHLYKKVGSVMARLAKAGEEIVTAIDGKIETKNTAKENDVVIKGLKGEEYIIGHEKFKARYTVNKPVSDDFTTYEPNGTCIAYEYQGESMVFMAPWNEEMIVHNGDFLATTDAFIPEVYRIERDAFFKTYQKLLNLNNDDEPAILSTN
jgi:hypothetical protein